MGWIMPLPLAMPAMRHSWPSSRKDTAISFFFVSVVMMDSAARSLKSPSPAASAAIPPAMGSRERGWPITPVLATITSEAGIPVCCSTRAHMPCAISIPSALQVLALPLLQTSARAYPSAIFARVTAMGGAPAPDSLYIPRRRRIAFHL